jgi:hypothetical protein
MAIFLTELSSGAVAGPTGASGIGGSTGPGGATGAPGVSNIPGATGATGINGSTGAGLPGATGIPGASGVILTALSADYTWTGKQSFVGSTSKIATKVFNVVEAVTYNDVTQVGVATPITFDVTTQSVLFYNQNATGVWTINIRGNGTTTLNTLVANGESITVVCAVRQGATAYRNTVVQVDGTNVTPLWQGGLPTGGNASGVDVYSYTLIKTATNTWTVLASQTQFRAT